MLRKYKKWTHLTQNMVSENLRKTLFTEPVLIRQSMQVTTNFTCKTEVEGAICTKNAMSCHLGTESETYRLDCRCSVN